MAVAAVDAGYLAASYSVPETTLQQLLSEPTAELVQTLLTQIEAKARAYDDVQSDKLRAHVELEAAVQGGEQRARALKATADKAQNEAEQLRQTLAHQAKARHEAETALHSLQTAASSSTSETQALESRIKTLESHNRDAIAMHEAKTAAHDRLAADLAQLHERSLDLRKHVSALEQKNQALESDATNVRFREANLQQEIAQLRSNNDWYTAELKTRSDDHTKYRKEKNAHIAQLQRDMADATETMDTLRRAETLLRQHVEELKTKADEDRLRIEQLENAAATAEANFRIELDGARRLAALHQQNNDMTKKRLEQLQADSERVQEDAAAEIGQLQADVELERNRAAEAEARTAELETLVETLKSDNSDLRSSVRVPGTPRHGMSMNAAGFSTPGRASSPAVFSPGGSQLKADASKTQLLIENNDLKKELRKVREKHEEQSSILNDMLQELERRQPEFDELRRQNDALVEQNNDMSNLLEEAIAEREAAQRDSRKAMGDLEGVQNECALLQRQVQDATIQLRSVLWRREAEENGIATLPQDQQRFIVETIEKNELPDHLLPDDSPTHNMITKHLVLYKNVVEMQQQNAELLRTIRQVGDEQEKQEARMASERYQKDMEELGRLRTLVSEKEEEIKTLHVRSQTLKTERDMYSRIVSGRGRGQGPSFSQSTSAFAQSVPATGAPLLLENGSQSREIPEYSKLIKDLQSHIDLLKEESATDRATLKSQVDNLTKDNSQLQSDKLRFESQVRREQDRYARLEGSIKLLQSEKDSLQERYNKVQATMAQQDDRLVQATQNAAEAEARLQSLQGEMVQLKASQQMSTTIEARLKERNQELMTERDRLSNMVSSIQSLRNEAELATAESRRELQSSVDKLRADLQNTERKLEDEIAEHKKATQMRDYERTEAQRRIDDLIAARNSAEVKSATADSTRQQLQQRVKDLQNQLQLAEERVQTLPPRATTGSNGEEDPANREEELVAEVAELGRKIKHKEEDLEAVTAQITGFQEIAQDAENRLQTFVEAHERLQEQLNLAQQEKDATISDLQQRVDDISSELATSSTELTQLRGQHEQDTLVLRQEKETLESEITRLNNDVADYKTEAENQTQYVKTQADIAERAQKDYEHEFQKHAESMEKLRELREQHNQLQTQVTEYKTQAEAARTTLEQSQDHWKTTESRYEDQITEAKRRHDDLKQYNQTLLKQFDEYKEQINSLKNERGAVATATAAAAGDAGSTEPGSSNLQDIEIYLRREKEILEVQLNLKVQESKRLEQQLTHAQGQLDQAREKLLEEQAKASGSQSNSSLAHLNKNLEELNVYRESNATLRSENSRLQNSFAEKARAFEALQGELEPLQIRVSELEGELELKAGHLKTVEEDRDRWQKRHQDVLQRYDRIDPKDLEDLKKQIQNHKVERDEALQQVTGFNEQITELTQKLEQAVSGKDAEVKVARERFQKIHNERMGEKKRQLEEITKERNEAQQAIESLKQELEHLKQQLANAQTAQTNAGQSQERITTLEKELEEARAQLVTAQQELEAANAARDEAMAQVNASSQLAGGADSGEEGQINEDSGATVQQLSQLQQQLGEAQQKASEAESNRSAAAEQLSSLQTQLSTQKDDLEKLQKETTDKGTTIDELRQQLSQAQAQDSQPASNAAPAEPVADTVAPAEIEKLKEELSAKAKEVDNLRAQLATAKSAEPSAGAETGQETSQDSDQVAAIKASLDQREAQLKELEASLNGREGVIAKKEGNLENLRKKANERVSAIRAETDAELARLKGIHEAELERLQQEKQVAATSNSVTAQEAPKEVSGASAEPLPEGMIKTDDLPRPQVTDGQLAQWFRANTGALRVVKAQIQNNLKKATTTRDETIAKLRQEVEQLNTQKAIDGITAVKQEPEQAQQAGSGENVGAINAAWEEKLKTKLQEKETSMTKTYEMKSRVKDSQLQLVRARFAYVETASKETPTEEVAKVYAIAMTQKPKPENKSGAQPATPAKTIQPQAQGQAVNTPTPSQPGATLAQQQQAAPSAANTPQANGTNHAPGTQPFQPAPFQQSAGHGNPVNPFLQHQNQMGRGLPQPGFVAQNQGQQQQQGRGRGDGVGTGPQAIRGALQSNIPRGGGTGIPLPGGRGRGQQQQQGQNANQNAGGPGASQIGRGGRGGGRGRGQPSQQQGQNQNQASPGQGLNLNPGAAGFQPGQAGRGQKRGAEDDGEGATRGGKRARGRGGGGGGGGGGAAPPATE